MFVKLGGNQRKTVALPNRHLTGFPAESQHLKQQLARTQANPVVHLLLAYPGQIKTAQRIVHGVGNFRGGFNQRAVQVK